MNVFIFDCTFDGLLTAVFDAFARHEFPEELAAENEPLPLFCETVHTVVTDDKKAERVWKALEKKLSKQAAGSLTVCWLSENRDIYAPVPICMQSCKVGTEHRDLLHRRGCACRNEDVKKSMVRASAHDAVSAFPEDKRRNLSRGHPTGP